METRNYFPPISLHLLSWAARRVLFHLGWFILVGSLTLIPRLGAASAPANDLFDNAIEIHGARASWSGSWFGATNEPGEQSWRDILVSDPQNTYPLLSGTSTVWYAWTAPASGVARLSLGSYNCLFAVFQGTSVSNLVRVDSGPSSSEVSGSFGRPFQVAAGQQYKIVVANCTTWDGAGPFSLNLDLTSLRVEPVSITKAPGILEFRCPPIDENLDGRIDKVWFAFNTGYYPNYPYPLAFVATNQPFKWRFANLATGYYVVRAVATNDHNEVRVGAPYFFYVYPANDEFANRLVLPGAHAYAEGSNYLADRGIGDPPRSAPPYGTGSTVWFEWTAPSTGPALAQMIGSSLAPSLFLMTGSNPTALDTLGSSTNGAPIRFNAVKGVPYQLCIDGPRWQTAGHPSSGGGGEFRFFIGALPFPPPELRAVSRADGSFVLETDGAYGRTIEALFSTDLRIWDLYGIVVDQTSFYEGLYLTNRGATRGFIKLRYQDW